LTRTRVAAGAFVSGLFEIMSPHVNIRTFGADQK
jgi:hypothetical protein